MFKSTKLLISALLVISFSASGSGLALAQEETPPIPDPGEVAAVTDIAYPSDVENVKAEPGDKLVKLTWDAATDNVGVSGYKIFYGTSSVSTDSASYTMGPVDVGNVLAYDVTGLENGKTYYFALTAYDAAGNESEFYSLEVSAKPGAGPSGTTSGEDKTAPTVINATALYKNEVKVIFSEAIKLPASNPQSAFTIKDDFLGTSLEVQNAELDASDLTGKSVILTTAEQKKSTKYILTAGIGVQDMSGNPIVSGTSDIASFMSSTQTKPAEEDVKPAAEEETPADTVAPTMLSVNVPSATTIEVTFSEPVVFMPNPAENFIITDFADNTKITNVNQVTVGQNGTVATLTTAPLAAQKYNLIVVKVQDPAGNPMPVQESATTFDGPADAAPVVPPVDPNPPVATNVEDAASDLVAKAMANLMVNLSWKTQEEKMADVANFVLYMSTDRGATYGPGMTLAKDLKSYNYQNLQADMVYYFKLTTRNDAGLESEGLITTLTLPATGPELALLLLFSGGAGAWVTRRKKK